MDDKLQEVKWNDCLGNRGRKAWLLLLKDDQVHVFRGKAIPGIVAIKGSNYYKQGKWSYTDYRLIVPKSERIIKGRDGWETGTFREAVNADTWMECANALGISLSSAQDFLRSFRPKDAEHFDEVDKNLESIVGVAEQEPDIEMLTITFGSPTLKEIDAGFWDAPVEIVQGNRLLATLRPPEYKSSSKEVKVMDVARSRGYHGGMVSIKVYAPVGAVIRHSAS